MNPLVYYALAVLCLCSIMTRRVWRASDGGDSSTAFLYAPVVASVWTIAACMLASIGLAAKKGTAVATIATVLLVACAIACVRSASSKTSFSI